MKKIGFATICAIGISTAAHAQNSIPGETQTQISVGERASIPASQILRIEADLAGTIGYWKGVRSCADRARLTGMLRGAYEKWVGQQVLAHADDRRISSGWTSATFTYSNGRKPWPSRARYCRGSFNSVPVFIEFRRQ